MCPLRSYHGVLGNCPVGRLAIGIATDICRYRSSAGRRHHRLAWVIRRFGDKPSTWICGDFPGFCQRALRVAGTDA